MNNNPVNVKIDISKLKKKIEHTDNEGRSKGRICPKCSKVFSLNTSECIYCNTIHAATNTLY